MGVRQRWIRVVPGTRPLLPPARLQYLKFLEPLKVTPLSREQAFKFRNFAKGTLYLNTNFILSKDLSKIIYTEPKYDALTAYPSSWGRSKPQHVGHQSRTPHGWHHFLCTLPLVLPLVQYTGDYRDHASTDWGCLFYLQNGIHTLRARLTVAFNQNLFPTVLGANSLLRMCGVWEVMTSSGGRNKSRSSAAL